MFTSFWVPSAAKMAKTTMLAALFAAQPTDALKLSDLLSGSAQGLVDQQPTQPLSQVRRDPEEILAQITAQVEALSKLRDAELAA